MKVIAMNLTLLFCLAYSASSFETRPDCQELPIPNQKKDSCFYDIREDTKAASPLPRNYPMDAIRHFEYFFSEILKIILAISSKTEENSIEGSDKELHDKMVILKKKWNNWILAFLIN